MNNIVQLFFVLLCIGKLSGFPHLIKPEEKFGGLARKPLADIVKQKLELFRDVVYNGNEQYKIPVLDVYKYNEPVDIEVNNKSIKFYCHLENIQATGLGKFETTELVIKVISKIFKLTIMIPELSVTGKYKMDGKYAQIVPIYGDGDATMTLKNLSLSIDGKYTTASGFQLDNPVVTLKLQDFQLKMTNLLNDEPLAEVVSEILSTAAMGYLEKMKPQLEDEIKELLQTALGENSKPNNSALKGFGSASPRSIAQANDYIDEILENLDNYIILNHLEPFDLPDFEQEQVISGGVGEVINLGVKGKNGKLKNVCTFHRTGDVYIESQGQHMKISANAGVYSLEASYDMGVLVVGSEMSTGATGQVRKLSMFMRVDVDLLTGKGTLEDFNITEFGHIDVNINTGIISPVGWILSAVLELFANLFKDTIEAKIEEIVPEIISQVIGGSW